jgi:hypothetical protein
VEPGGCRWGGLGGGHSEITSLEYIVWKLGNHGIELGRGELELSEKMVVGARVDSAKESNIG